MEDGPPGSPCRGRSQTTARCVGSRAGVLSVADKAHRECVRCEPRRRAKANHTVTRRKRRDDIKTGGSRYPGTSLVGTCLLTRRCPAWRWRELGSGSGTERGNLALDTDLAAGLRSGRRERDSRAAETARDGVATRGTGADRPVVAAKSGNAGGAKGASCPDSFGGQPGCPGGTG